MEKFKEWLIDQTFWSGFSQEQNFAEFDLLRSVVHLDEYAIGIGKMGLYRLTYGFSAQVKLINIKTNQNSSNVLINVCVYPVYRFALSV